MMKEYFSYTRKERVAIITLILLIIGIYLLPQFIKTPGSPPTAAQLKALAGFQEHLKNSDSGRSHEMHFDKLKSKAYSFPDERESKGELFYFDPNTASAREWQRLGIREKTIGTIAKYLGKGGHFNNPEDLKKIYGLKENEYERLSPYIRINGKDRRMSRDKDRQFENRVSATEPERFVKTRAYTRLTAIDLNAADTAALIALPGIGSKLASRIISFRDKLGGFHSVYQVAEIYGLPDSTFQKIKPFLVVSSTGVRGIDINTANIDQLKQHPYIRWALANAIIKYRDQHGLFRNAEDLKSIGAISEEAFKKMAPYIATN